MAKRLTPKTVALPSGRRCGEADEGATPAKRATLFATHYPLLTPHQLTANFTSLIASKFCTPPPTRFVV